jgi:TolB protein
MISMLRKFTIATLALLGFVFASTAHAQLRVEIAGVGASQIPIAIATFANEAIAPQLVTEIIKADLTRSGIFKIIPTTDTLSENAPIDYAAWKAKGADALVIGSVQQLADGRFDVRYRLLDILKDTQLSAFSIGSQASLLRLTAHKIADDIYEKLTGIPGIFATKIAYVNKSGGEYRLEIADADGYNNQTALRSHEPIISPTWSPDGTKLAYVSFELNKPVVYIQNWVTKQRTVASNFKGNNSAPAWSPDGLTLALALSRDGISQVYVMGVNGGGLRRVTNTFGIETEPRFSPDGQSLYFTSDRSGGPQIYKTDLSSGETRRVTFAGSYNTSPRISPDGRTLAYVSRRDGKFQIYSLDLSNGQEQRLSDTGNDAAPSFAPNGKYILYASEYGGRGSLAVVSVDGRVKQRITTQVGDIREPTWGPFMK